MIRLRKSSPMIKKSRHADLVKRDTSDAVATIPAAEAKQSTIFDLGVAEPMAAVSSEMSEGDFPTKDLISLSDVPVSTGEHVKLIEVEVLVGEGRYEIQKKHGKILHRRGPHPSVVRIGNKIIPRDAASEMGGDIKPVMINYTTIITYEGGVVLPIHHDVLLVLIGMWHARYRDTGITSSQIETTKAQIACRLGVGVNQRTRQYIEDALLTIRGVTVTKHYDSPDGTEVVAGSRIEVIGGIISNFSVDRHGEGSNSRSKSDNIMVEFNGGLIRAMTGATEERQWNVRTFNLTRNLSYQTAWKRQLARMAETRLDYSGRFQIPLRELWVDCLGGNEADTLTSANWRLIKHRIKLVFEDWLAADWIKNLEWNSSTRDYGVVSSGEEDASTSNMGVGLVGGRKGHVRIPRRRRVNDGGWVRCEAGPAFTAGMGLRKSSLAMDLARATTDSVSQAESLLKAHSKDFIIDVAYGRLKHLITHMGDRLTRLDIPHWLSPMYPVPDRQRVVLVAFRSRRLVQAQSQFGPAPSPVPAPFFDRRLELLRSVTKAKTTKITTNDLLDETSVIEGMDQALLTEMRACCAVAIDLHLEVSTGLSREILSAENRINDPAAERAFEDLVKSAREVALDSALLLLWYRRLADQVVMKTIPTLGRNSIDRVKLLASAKRRLPEAYKLIHNMQAPDRLPWEAHVGSLLELRMLERVVEEDEIAELEARRSGR